MSQLKELNTRERDSLLRTLRDRFEQHQSRHPGVKWTEVEARLTASPLRLSILHAMEQSGGEPDVVGAVAPGGEYTFVDCAPQSPKGRRSVCYDHDALRSRKEHKPKDSALGMAAKMGAAILTEQEYRALQEFGIFDTTTSSWVATPEKIRSLGGALFCDRRYDTVFVYHNGAESYYAARGFRCSLRV